MEMPIKCNLNELLIIMSHSGTKDNYRKMSSFNSKTGTNLCSWPIRGWW